MSSEPPLTTSADANPLSADVPVNEPLSATVTSATSSEPPLTTSADANPLSADVPVNEPMSATVTSAMSSEPPLTTSAGANPLSADVPVNEPMSATVTSAMSSEPPLTTSADANPLSADVPVNEAMSATVTSAMSSEPPLTTSADANPLSADVPVNEPLPQTVTSATSSEPPLTTSADANPLSADVPVNEPLPQTVTSATSSEPPLTTSADANPLSADVPVNEPLSATVSSVEACERQTFSEVLQSETGKECRTSLKFDCSSQSVITELTNDRDELSSHSIVKGSCEDKNGDTVHGSDTEMDNQKENSLSGSDMGVTVEGLKETTDVRETVEPSSIYVSDDSDIEVIDIKIDGKVNPDLQELSLIETDALVSTEVPCINSAMPAREHSLVGQVSNEKEATLCDVGANVEKDSSVVNITNAVKETTYSNEKVVENDVPDFSIMITDVRSLNEGAETNTVTDNILSHSKDPEDNTVIASVSQTIGLQNMQTNSFISVNDNSTKSSCTSSTINHSVNDVQQNNVQDDTPNSINSLNETLNSSCLESGTGLPSTTNMVTASSPAHVLSSSLEDAESVPITACETVGFFPSHPSQDSNPVSVAETQFQRSASSSPLYVASSVSLTKKGTVPLKAATPLSPPISQMSSALSPAISVVSMPALSVTLGADLKSRSKPDSQVPATAYIHVTSAASSTRSVSEAVIESCTASSIVSNESFPHLATRYSSAAEIVKAEPIDQGVYGKMLNDSNSAQQDLTADRMSVIVHKGHKLNSFTSRTGAQIAPKIVITKVNKINSVVTSKSSTFSKGPTPRLLPKGLDNKRMLYRQQLPVLDQIAKMNQAISTNKSQLSTTANNNKTSKSSAVTVRMDKKLLAEDEAEQTVQLKQLSTINIHSVGVSRVTDLIARKNPLPAYKPLPVPDNIRDSKKLVVHACYECGDTFHLAKSLQQHVGRCIMQINYNCENCSIRHTFINKCQLLSHLRSHLNLEKTQAVPIHIKSDSIEIISNYDEIVPGKPFEWYRTNIVQPNDSLTAKSATTTISTGTCGQCKSVFHQKKALVEHFEGMKTNRFFCTECPMHLNSSCAMAAHMSFHKLASIFADATNLSEEQWKLIKTLQCPECGMKFGEQATKNTPIKTYIQDAVHHLGKECFHLSRLTGIKCVRCGSMCNGTSGLQNHLQTRLEHYFKCELCPMALKSVKSVKAHFIQKHKAASSSGVKAKVIYRCHVCDTLIDDKSFLVQHISMHIEEHKVNTSVSFHCLQCGEMFQEKDDLVKHTAENHMYVKRKFICACKRKFASPLRYMVHVLDFNSNCHPILTPTVETDFCERCGIVCVGKAALKNHICLALNDVVVIVGDKSKPEEKKSPVQKSVSAGNKQELNGEKTCVYKESSTNTPVDLPEHLSKTCVWCSLLFVSVEQRERHLRAHQTKEKVYVCIYCDYKNAKTYHDLKSHEISCSAIRKMNLRQANMVEQMNVAKNEDADEVQLTSKKISKRPVVEVKEYFMCEECSAIFTRKSQKEEHIKSEHGIHPCHLCGIVYDSQSCLKKHLSLAHEGKLVYFYCKICKGHNIDKAFRYKDTLIRHLKGKHRAKVFDESNIIAQFPGQPEFAKESTPETHSMKHSSGSAPELPIKKLRVEGEDVFKCAKCAYVSKSKDEFRQHILIHKAAETYQCFECGLCFAVFPSLKKHVFIVHKIKDFENYMKENLIEEPSMLEDIDVKREPSKQDFESEPSSPEEDDESNSLECKVCYKQFDTMKNLVAHIRVHGMAFIRKNRRQTKGTSCKRKKSVDDVVHDNIGGADAENDGLTVKIKKIRTDSYNSNNEEEMDEKVDNESNASYPKDLKTNDFAVNKPVTIIEAKRCVKPENH